MRRVTLPAASLLLVASLAACSAGGPPSPSPVAARTDAPTAAPTTAASIETASATPMGPSPSATPRPAPTPTAVRVPPKPSGVRFDEQTRVSDDESAAEITQRVTWKSPRTAGVEIRVYGVTECIAEPASPRPATSGPCLVEHTALPDSVRTLLASAPASAGVASWTWTQQTGCEVGLANDPDGPRYHAVVLASYSASGHSIFAIAEPGEWWEPGPGDVVC
jgi:hypothetical protein